MSKIFLVSDTHFFHSNIIKYCNRPFASVEEMNRVMIEKWNAVVSPEDTVIHLGDFALGPAPRYAEILKALHGKTKILIIGNHDKSAVYMKENVGFDQVYQNRMFDFGEHGDWFLKHKPMKTPKKLLHGHVHQSWRRLGEFVINASVDVWDFYPQTLAQMLSVPTEPMDYKCNCGEILKRLENNRDHWEHKQRDYRD